jgi:hypothetical protein
VSECRSEAQPKICFFVSRWKSRCLAFAQHDSQVICSIATQSQWERIIWRWAQGNDDCGFELDGGI